MMNVVTLWGGFFLGLMIQGCPGERSDCHETHETADGFVHSSTRLRGAKIVSRL
jgi:hypothetical protein